MEERLICMRLSNAALLELVASLAAPSIEQAGCVLWDVEFVKEAGERYLRVYIDNDEGVSIDQCELVSRALDKALDEADPIDESYILEVSSAGAERQLKRPSDFEKFMGSQVAVKLYSAREGRKEHIGILASYSDGNVGITVGDRTIDFNKNEIASVRLRIDF